MKSIILVSVFLNSLCISPQKLECKEHYSVQVWDYNYSMAYTIFYKIGVDSVTVKFISGIINEKDSILMQRPIRKNQCKMIFDFFSSHNIDRFKDKYSNPMVDDGDRKKVVFTVKDKSKTVEIANFFQKDMDDLFSVINKIVKIVNKDLQIKYKRSS